MHGGVLIFAMVLLAVHFELVKEGSSCTLSGNGRYGPFI